MAFEGRRRSPLGREDLPEHFTPETLRDLPIGAVRLLRDPRNGVLSADEQAEFDRALDEVMGGAARRVHGQLTPVDLARLAGRERQRRGGPGGMRRDETLDRMVRRLGDQVELAEQLAPRVDWSFVPPEVAGQDSGADGSIGASGAGQVEASPDDEKTVAELEDQLSEQAELVAMMGELAEVNRRTLALEQERELSSARGLFFGFIVSVSVIAAGWAPIVMATPSSAVTSAG